MMNNISGRMLLLFIFFITINLLVVYQEPAVIFNTRTSFIKPLAPQAVSEDDTGNIQEMEFIDEKLNSDDTSTTHNGHHITKYTSDKETKPNSSLEFNDDIYLELTKEAHEMTSDSVNEQRIGNRNDNLISDNANTNVAFNDDKKSGLPKEPRHETQPDLPRKSTKYTEPGLAMGLQTILKPNLNQLRRNSILVYVLSVPSQFIAREMVRNTWGDNGLYVDQGMDIRVIFTVGTSKVNLVNESREFQDIIQFDIVDSYDNLVVKNLMTMHWIQRNTVAEYIFKVDEDVLPNMYAYIKLVKSAADQGVSCFSVGKSGFGRLHRSGKWGETLESYPLDYYPTCMVGPSYLMSRQAVTAILELHNHTVGYMHLEDVFITGVLGNQANVHLLSIDRVKCYIHLPLAVTLDNILALLQPKLETILYIHKVPTWGVPKVWQAIRDHHSNREPRPTSPGDSSDHVTQIPDRWRIGADVKLEHQCRREAKLNSSIVLYI